MLPFAACEPEPLLVFVTNASAVLKFCDRNSSSVLEMARAAVHRGELIVGAGGELSSAPGDPLYAPTNAPMGVKRFGETETIRVVVLLHHPQFVKPFIAAAFFSHPLSTVIGEPRQGVCL